MLVDGKSPDLRVEHNHFVVFPLHFRGREGEREREERERYIVCVSRLVETGTFVMGTFFCAMHLPIESTGIRPHF